MDFVDCHSHVVPGVDDGAPTVEAAQAMLAAAAAGGTRLLIATPHAGPRWYAFDDGGEHRARVEERFAALRPPATMELRLGWEVTPSPPVLRGDPGAFRLPGSELVLVHGPGFAPTPAVALLEDCVRHVLAHGLTPIVAHPERRAAWADGGDALPERLRALGALIQVDRASLLGEDGPATRREAWRIVGAGLCDLVASDAHDAAAIDLRSAYEQTRLEHGEALADRLYRRGPSAS